jgi:serine/threonine-protein kinase RsbW
MRARVAGSGAAMSEEETADPDLGHRRGPSRPPEHGSFRIDVTALAVEVSRIRHAVIAEAQAQGIARELRADIALAVGEACANVVAHAYVDAPTPGPLTVETYREKGTFVVIVSDEGIGIAPRADSPGLGMGLPLIARLTDRLQIESNGRGGGKLTMAFAAA